MTVVWILAHFDDEYCGLPLIDEARAAGHDQLFLYVADYDSARVRAQRHAESRRFLGWLGVRPESVIHVAAGRGVPDGGVHTALPAALAALTEALVGVEVERIICPAWEGGHMDHDMCCLLAARVGAARDAPVEMISLYNGHRIPAPFFHAGRPLVANGPVRRVVIAGGMVRWMAAVRFFWLQRAWLGLWPAMFWTYGRQGFGVQRLDPARLTERPHGGTLLYERMFSVAYDEVRTQADRFIGRG
jgi:hypothetical protein